MKTSSIYRAISYREELAKMPPGFFAFQEEQGKKWKVYFKSSIAEKPVTIQSYLTQKQAEKKSAALNLALG